MSKPRRLPPQISNDDNLGLVFGTLMPYIGLIAVMSLAGYGFWVANHGGGVAIFITSLIIMSAAAFGLSWLARKDFGGPRSARRAKAQRTSANARDKDAA